MIDLLTRKIFIVSVLLVLATEAHLNAQTAGDRLAWNDQEEEWITETLEGIVQRDDSQSARPITSVEFRLPAGYTPWYDGTNRGKLSARDFVRLSKLTELNSLELNGFKFQSKDLAILAGHENLKTLVLANTSIDELCVKHIVGISGLESLELRHIYIKDFAILIPLENLEALSELKLNAFHGSGQNEADWIRSVRWAAATKAYDGIANSRPANNEHRGGMSDKDLVVLSKLNLDSLSLSLTRVTDEGVRQIVEMFPNLKKLDISRTDLGRKGLHQISRLKKLESLNISMTPVSLENATGLSQLTNLRELILYGAPVTDRGLKSVLPGKNLVSLNLDNTLITGFSIELIGALPNLSELRFDNTKIDFQGLKQLAEMQNKFDFRKVLVSSGRCIPAADGRFLMLDLKRLGMNDEDAAFLADFPETTQLELSGNQLTNEVLNYVVALESLRSLKLANTGVNDLGISQLTPLGSLRSIDVRNTNVTLSGLCELFVEGQGRTPEEALKISGFHLNTSSTHGWNLNLTNEGVTDEDLSMIIRIPGIRRLVLRGNQITDRGLESLSHHSELEAVWLREENITGKSLSHLATIPNLTTLLLIDARIENEDLKLLDQFPKLESLNLCGCAINETAVPYLSRLQSLSMLFVDTGTFGKDSLEELVNQRPGLMVHESQRTDIACLRGRKRQNMSRSMDSNHAKDRYRVSTRIATHAIPRFLGDEFLEEAIAVGSLQNNKVQREDFAAMSRLESLESISISNVDLPIGTFDLIDSLPNLKSLSFYRSNLGTNQLRDVPVIQQISTLGLENSSVTQEELNDLPNLPNLKTLRIGGTGTSITDLDFVQRMPNLESLSLFRTNIDGDDFASIKELTNLKNLRVGQTSVSDGLDHLSKLENLHSIDLSNTRINNDSIQYLEKLSNLKHLDLGGTMVSASRIKSLGEVLPKLSVSSIMAINDRDYELLGSFHESGFRYVIDQEGNVIDIQLHNAFVDYQLLAAIQQLKNLNSIGLGKHWAAKFLADPPRLNSQVSDINISGINVTACLLQRLVESFELDKLRFSGCHLSADAVELIGQQTQLTELEIHNCPFTDDNVAMLAGLKNLTDLKLNFTSVSDRSMKTIKGFHRLQRLEIIRAHVTDQGLVLLADLPDLKAVNAQLTNVKFRIPFRFMVTR